MGTILMPLTEPCVRFSPTRPFGSASSSRGRMVRPVIYLGLRQRIPCENPAEFLPGIALLLAASIRPLVGESQRCPVILLQPFHVPAHSIVAVMSCELLAQCLPPYLHLYSISGLLQPLVHRFELLPEL